jgi:hypothetical protein
MQLNDVLYIHFLSPSLIFDLGQGFRKKKSWTNSQSLYINIMAISAAISLTRYITFKDYLKLNGAHQFLVYADDVDFWWKCIYYKEKQRSLSNC